MTPIDMQLKQYVDEELRSDPGDDAAQIGVGDDNGADAPFGMIDSYAEESTAEDDTRPQGRHRLSTR